MASASAFVAVQAACWVWGAFAFPSDVGGISWSQWRLGTAVFALVNLGTAIWSIAAWQNRRVASLVVVPMLFTCEAYLLRWEWALFIWRTRGFAP